jgi:hypothetical protein
MPERTTSLFFNGTAVEEVLVMAGAWQEYYAVGDPKIHIIDYERVFIAFDRGQKNIEIYATKKDGQKKYISLYPEVVYVKFPKEVKE